jgi:microcystin-dependent protein
MASSVSTNQFRSSKIYGTLTNIDTTNKSILANAIFQRNVSVGGNLILGTETIDENNNAVDSDSNIQFTLDKVLYNIPLRTLSYIRNLTSDVQQQIQDIEQPSNGNTFTDLTVTGNLNGLIIKNYGNSNTSFSTGNTLIFGNNNTRFGYFTGLLSGYSNAVFGDQSLQNCTGNSNTAIGHNSQNSNTSYSYNTSLGSSSDIIGGHSNVAIGCIAQCNNCSNSVALGANVTCTTSNQILLGNSSHSVSIPGTLDIHGKISQNIGNQNTAFGLYSFSSNYSGGYNSAFGYNSLTSNTGGAYCTAIGCNSLQFSNAFGNTAIGYNSGINISNGTYNTFIGHNAQASYDVSNSTAIGYNSTCNASNQIMVGTSAETVVIPGILTFNQSINNISSAIFGYLSGLSSNIQQQINNSNSNISTLQNKTIDILWTPGQINKTTIGNQCETNTLSFTNTLNNISTTTFSYLSGLNSNIQQQINNLGVNPAGAVITYAGTTNTLNGYLLCDGAFYNLSQYPYLFNAIGYTYGDGGNGNFRVPNYKGIFLRGAGSQDVQLNVIAGGGAAIFKNFQAPDLGRAVPDQSAYFSTGNYVDQISTQTRTVVTGSPILLGNYSTANVISSLDYTTTNNSYNFGNPDVHPAHTSVNYFIKY